MRFKVPESTSGMQAFDLHSHTHYSNDAITLPENVLKFNRKQGYFGFAVTDHGKFDAWNYFKKEAKKFDLMFIPGVEWYVFKDEKPQGEIIALFLQEPLEKKHRDIWAFLDECHAQDALLIAPHPFEKHRKGLKCLQEKEVLKKIHATEGINSRAYFWKYNLTAQKFLEQHPELTASAGSDAHTPWELGNAAIYLNATNEEEFRKSFLKHQTIIAGRRAPWSVHVWTQLAKRNLAKDKEREI